MRGLAFWSRSAEAIPRPRPSFYRWLLRRLASRRLAEEKPGQTLQEAALDLVRTFGLEPSARRGTEKRNG